MTRTLAPLRPGLRILGPDSKCGPGPMPHSGSEPLGQLVCSNGHDLGIVYRERDKTPGGDCYCVNGYIAFFLPYAMACAMGESEYRTERVEWLRPLRNSFGGPPVDRRGKPIEAFTKNTALMRVFSRRELARMQRL